MSSSQYTKSWSTANVCEFTDSEIRVGCAPATGIDHRPSWVTQNTVPRSTCRLDGAWIPVSSATAPVSP